VAAVWGGCQRGGMSAPQPPAAELATVLGPRPPAFALLHRPWSRGPDTVELLIGTAGNVDRLADLPLPPLAPGAGDDIPELLALVPYQQLAERGFACRADGTPLTTIRVDAHRTLRVDDVLAALPDDAAVLRGGRFSPSDAGYRATVRRILAEEIGWGEGSNFVIRRTYRARIANHSPRVALAIFRRLLAGERGAYWTFMVHAAGRTLIGASPERHVSLADGVATMNPVSGTYRYPPDGPSRTGLLRFLADRKEAEELYMVVDEELKMLGRICRGGARVHGPELTEMAHLAHTGYQLVGRTELDARAVLRETMFGPTVTGSPLENACRVIARHERRGRAYYGGAVALFGRRDGRRTLDSAITIRTVDIRADGRMELGVGATLVRRSDPYAEVAETHAKAAGLLAAVTGDAPGGRPEPVAPQDALATDPRVIRVLAARNDRLARFWLGTPARSSPAAEEFAGRRLLVIDAGDTFTAMLAHQLRALGPSVSVRGWDGHEPDAAHDAVVVGPGPGDPRHGRDPRIAVLRRIVSGLLASGTPVLAVCLGHQVLASQLGLPLRRRPVPAQGEQREIDLFGAPEWVGFYNTFAAYCEADELPGGVEVARDPVTGEVFALRGTRLWSMQFHPESVLTRQGLDILRKAIGALLGGHHDAGRSAIRCD
jgi:2-amino-4-deoxychorismate synthase